MSPQPSAPRRSPSPQNEPTTPIRQVGKLEYQLPTPIPLLDQTLDVGDAASPDLVGFRALQSVDDESMNELQTTLLPPFELLRCDKGSFVLGREKVESCIEEGREHSKHIAEIEVEDQDVEMVDHVPEYETTPATLKKDARGKLKDSRWLGTSTLLDMIKHNDVLQREVSRPKAIH